MTTVQVEVTAATFVDQITVDEFNRIAVRTTTRYMEGELRIADRYHRHVLEPWQDISSEDERVRKVGAAVWTEAIVADAIAKRQTKLTDAGAADERQA